MGELVEILRADGLLERVDALRAAALVSRGVATLPTPSAREAAEADAALREAAPTAPETPAETAAPSVRGRKRREG